MIQEKLQNKEKYEELCANNVIVPHLFSQPWWLDIVCTGGGWDVALAYDKGGNVIGSLPFSWKEYWGIRVLKMPQLTPFFDIWLQYPQDTTKVYHKNTFEKQVLTELIKQLPRVAFFSQKYHYDLVNWLPFYWQGFRQTTRYSLVLDNLSKLEEVFANFSSKTRGKIRAAERKFIIEERNDPIAFWKLNKKTFEVQGKAIPYQLDFFLSLDEALGKRQVRKILFAVDSKGIGVAALYLVWDQYSAYYFASGMDRELDTYGTMPLLVWRAIEHSAQIVSRFDFEGSMLPGVETFFSSFGSIQKPYFELYKAQNRFFEAFKILIKG